MSGVRIGHGLHPTWCDLGPGCEDSGRDGRHVGLVSTTFPAHDDVRVEVELVRQDDIVSSMYVAPGPPQICLRLTNTACVNMDGSPMVADTHLSQGDALALAHMLQTYAKRLERTSRNCTADIIRGEVEPIGSTDGTRVPSGT